MWNRFWFITLLIIAFFLLVISFLKLKKGFWERKIAKFSFSKEKVDEIEKKFSKIVCCLEILYVILVFTVTEAKILRFLSIYIILSQILVNLGGMKEKETAKFSILNLASGFLLLALCVSIWVFFMPIIKGEADLVVKDHLISAEVYNKQSIEYIRAFTTQEGENGITLLQLNSPSDEDRFFCEVPVSLKNRDKVELYMVGLENGVEIIFQNMEDLKILDASNESEITDSTLVVKEEKYQYRNTLTDCYTDVKSKLQYEIYLSANLLN